MYEKAPREVDRAVAPLARDSAEADEAERHDKQLPLMPSLKKWKKTVLYCVALTPCILMFGYDYAIVGTSSAMPSFQ